MGDKSDRAWADLSWWYGFKAGWGAAWLADLALGAVGYGVYRWWLGP